MVEQAIMKNNALTQMMDAVRLHNAGVQPFTVGSGPGVRSSAMSTVNSLSREEVLERNRLARAAGIDLPLEDDEEAGYPTREEAERDGAPIRTTAREVISAEENQKSRSLGPFTVSKLPDFTKVEGYDFFRNVIYIDGLEFPIPTEDIPDMKAYAVKTAIDFMTTGFMKALVEFGLPAESLFGMADTLRESAKNASIIEMQMRECGHFTGEHSGAGGTLPLVHTENVPEMDSGKQITEESTGEASAQKSGGDSPSSAE